MGKWSKRFGKILTAAGISAFIAVSSLAMPIEVFAARCVTDDVMIRNDASTEAGLIGSLNEGDEVEILDVVAAADGYNWYYIQLDNGATGYVRSDLIEASDEELAQFNVAQEEPEEETESEEEAQEPAEEAPAEETQEAEAAATQAPAAPAVTDGEYDAAKDPNAGFTVSYDTEADGTGEWYVHNTDNGGKWKVADLLDQDGAAAAASGGVASIWRTLAILFGILAIGLAAFVLFLLKSIREGRSKTTRGRALEAAAAAAESDDSDDDDEYYFEDDDEDQPDDGESSDDEEESGENDTDSEYSDQETEDAEGGSDEGDEESEETKVTPDSTITKDVPEQADVTEIHTDEIEAAIAATTAQLEKNISDDDAKAAAEKETFQTDAREVVTDAPAGEVSYEAAEVVESAEEVSEEEDGEVCEEEVYEEEDYEEEDYEDEDDGDEPGEPDSDEDVDEDYEDEDYEDYEDDEEDDSRAAKSSAKGGFFGFLKKVFGTDSKEDEEDEGEDFDDYDDEPDEHEFDEFKEYPEDIDLLPREESDDQDYAEEEEEYADEESAADDKERGRLSMQRVMKNVSYKEEEADFSQSVDSDDIENSLFEDDDDMEYSFISSTRRK